MLSRQNCRRLEQMRQALDSFVTLLGVMAAEVVVVAGVFGLIVLGARLFGGQ